jgi:Fe2+ or Zn2+ uptake regulation protein
VRAIVRSPPSKRRVVKGVNHPHLFPFVCGYCGDRCVSEVPEIEAIEEARENFGAAIDKHPEKFMTVCQECFELLLEDSVEACRACEAQEKRRAN